jgi:hypothetical protein
VTLTLFFFGGATFFNPFFGQRKKTRDHVRELFESRARAEDDAISARTPHNRLHVSSLVQLLKERQDMVVDDSAGSSTVATKKQLAGKYGMDVELLEKLVRNVNVPSDREMPLGGAGAGAGSVRYDSDAESGEDIAVREVSWLFSYELISAL